MPNVYVIKCVVVCEKSGLVPAGYLSIADDTRTVQTKQAARHFHSLLAADAQAIYLDLTYPGWTHIVEVL